MEALCNDCQRAGTGQGKKIKKKDKAKREKMQFNPFLNILS